MTSLSGVAADSEACMDHQNVVVLGALSSSLGTVAVHSLGAKVTFTSIETSMDNE